MKKITKNIIWIAFFVLVLGFFNFILSWWLFDIGFYNDNLFAWDLSFKLESLNFGFILVPLGLILTAVVIETKEMFI